jgi:proline dehydrogenase
MFLLRKPILALSGNGAVRDALVNTPVTRAVVERFIAGETSADAVVAVSHLRGEGLQVSLDHLGEDTTDRATADATVDAYLGVIRALAVAGQVAGTELSVKLSAVGQALVAAPDLPAGGNAYALDGARRIADAAYAAGARVNLDMEDHTTVDQTLEVLFELRRSHPDVGIAIQAMLLRTPKDLAELTGPGSRVRLVKGAYDEPADVAYTDPAQIDLAYVRAMKVLMYGKGYPMIASHDPRIVAIADRIAADAGRTPDRWEHQMLYGIRPDEQRRLVAAGRTVRVYVPYGSDWYGYFTRRLAERPANLLFFLRSLAGKS